MTLTGLFYILVSVLFNVLVSVLYKNNQITKQQNHDMKVSTTTTKNRYSRSSTILNTKSAGIDINNKIRNKRYRTGVWKY